MAVKEEEIEFGKIIHDISDKSINTGKFWHKGFSLFDWEDLIHPRRYRTLHQ